MAGHAPVSYREYQEVYPGKHGIYQIVTVNVVTFSDYSN